MKENMHLYVHVPRCCSHPNLSDKSSSVTTEVLLRGSEMDNLLSKCVSLLYSSSFPH